MKLARPRAISTRFAAGSGSASASSSLLLVVAGVVARSARSPECRTTIIASLAEVQAEASLAEPALGRRREDNRSGSRYLDTRDSTAQDAVPHVRMGRARGAAPDERASEPVGDGSRDASRRSTTSCRRWKSTTRSRIVSPTSAATDEARRAASDARDARSTTCSADIERLGQHQGRQGRRGAVRSRDGDRRGARPGCSSSSASPSCSASSS